MKKIIFFASFLFAFNAFSQTTTTLGDPLTTNSFAIVPVTVNTIDNVDAISMAIAYDSLMVSFEGYQLATPPLDNDLYILDTGDELRVTWLNDSLGVNSLSLTSGGILFHLIFNLHVYGTSQITWSVIPGECEYADPNANIVNSLWVDGEITYDTLPSTLPSSFGFTPNPYSGTLVGVALIDSIPASSLDYIAAFDPYGNCAGFNQLIDIGDGNAYINLVIYGDDPTTLSIDEGLNIGEDFYLKLWDVSDNLIISYMDNYGFDIPLSGWINNNGAPMPGYNDYIQPYDFLTTIVLGPPPISDFSTNYTTVNVGDIVSFNDLSTNNPAAWAWLIPGANPDGSTLQNPTVVYETAGLFNVTLVTFNASGSSTEIKYNYVLVNDTSAVVAPVTDFIASNTNIAVDETISFFDLTLNNPISWTWLFPGGMPNASSVANPMVSYNSPGIYDVTLITFNQAGSDTEVKNSYIVVNDSTINIIETDKNRIVLLNNFNDSKIIIQANERGLYSSEIYSISGQLLSQHRFEKQLSLSTKQLLEGIYIVLVRDGNQVLKREKFIVVH